MLSFPRVARSSLWVVTAAAAWALVGCKSSSDSSTPPSVFDDAAITAYVQSVADAVAGDSTYRVIVYDAEFVQAFALPGDEIGLTTGLLKFIHNEAELACVLGHEIAHYQLGHVSDFFGGEASPPVAESHPLALGWPEAQEQAADDLGLSLCAAAGYEPLSVPILLFRAAQVESGETVDVLRALDASANSVVERTRRAVSGIAASDIDGGRIGYPEYAFVLDTLVAAVAAGAPQPTQSAGPNIVPWILVGGAVAVGLNYEEFTEDNQQATLDWLRRECGREGVTVVPTNYEDAYGHCWAGCRAQELCGFCLNPGVYYEVAREAGYGGDEHDSFWQDLRNQEIGSRGALTDQSCADYCNDKIESGGLDLSAPQRKWRNCGSLDLEDERPHGGMYSDYGALGSPDIFGDPHLRTIDGLSYDFHGVGEFVAVESTVDDLVVQVRLTEVAVLQASKTTAVAANVNGDRVGAYLGPSSFVVRVNGELADPRGSWVRLPNGGYVQVETDEVVFQWPDDTRLWVYYWGNVLDIAMTLPAQRQAALSGLLGNADGDPTNEYFTREGAPVDVPDEPRDARRDALYGEFGESWRIDAAESLFDYEPGESSDDFQSPGFPMSSLSIDDLDEVTRREARADCISLGVTESPWLEDCIFDVGFTGELSWASSARNAADPDSLTWNEMYESQGAIEGEDTVIMEEFLGQAGDAHFFRFTETMASLGLANWEVIAPSGDRLFLNCVYRCGQPGEYVLPESGLYVSRLTADPGESGLLTVARNVVPDPQVFDIGSGVTSVNLEQLGPGAGTISLPGGEDIYRIDGRSGMTITLTPVDIDGAIQFGQWKLTDPNGTVLFDVILPLSGGTPRSQDLVRDGIYELSITGGNSWPSEWNLGFGDYSILFEVAATGG